MVIYCSFSLKNGGGVFGYNNNDGHRYSQSSTSLRSCQWSFIVLSLWKAGGGVFGYNNNDGDVHYKALKLKLFTRDENLLAPQPRYLCTLVDLWPPEWRDPLTRRKRGVGWGDRNMPVAIAKKERKTLLSFRWWWLLPFPFRPGWHAPDHFWLIIPLLINYFNYIIIF